jgi:hypothetical protein
MNDQTPQPAAEQKTAPVPSHLRGEPVRAIRVPDRLWNEIKGAATAEQMTVSDFIRGALETAVEGVHS